MKLTGSERSDCRSVSQYDLARGLDANCNYFNVTWLKFTGKTMEQEVGAGWLEGVHPEDKGCCMDTYLASFERRESFGNGIPVKRHDGLWRWINDRGVPTFDAEHRFTGYIGAWTLPRRLRAKADRSGALRYAHQRVQPKLSGDFNRF